MASVAPSMTIQTGKLDQVITLQSLVETTVSGELLRSYTDIQDVWGHVKTSRGTEALEAARTNAREVIRVLLRYRDDVEVKWRIVWEGQTYNVVSVDRSSRREGQLWLNCEVVGFE